MFERDTKFFYNVSVVRTGCCEESDYSGVMSDEDDNTKAALKRKKNRKTERKIEE